MSTRDLDFGTRLLIALGLIGRVQFVPVLAEKSSRLAKEQPIPHPRSSERRQGRR
jgi:hypothetical protein